MMVLFTAVSYLAVRAFAPQKLLNGLTFCVGITTALVTVLYVLNIFNIDLIGTYADTAVVERAQFFSTLGQKKLLLRLHGLCAAAGVLCVFGGPRGAQVLYGVPAFFGGLALAVVDADGLALGIGAAVLVLLCQKIFTTRTLRRLMVIGMFFLCRRRLDAVHAYPRLHPGRQAHSGGLRPLCPGGFLQSARWCGLCCSLPCAAARSRCGKQAAC